MSQKTDLNVSPYFDDFDPSKNFNRVLFKPGFPVQSRELITLQSILQNQIELFGSHFFKEGSVVIPGNTTYDPNYYAVKINDSHLGLNVGLYLNSLIGKKIKGQNSQLTAIVKNVLLKSDPTVDTYTLYVKYLSSDVNFSSNQFINGETLISLDTFNYGNTTINSGETIASLISNNATSTGSAVSVSKGVYYIRGSFIVVDDQTLILDRYTNTPSYRVGFNIQETIEFASDKNPDLFDNARGFANYSAPGADRLKITAILSKKAINDFQDQNFIEILRVSNGVVKKLQNDNAYSLIREYIAKRTYDESGDYSLVPFNIDVKNSLNDRISSDGIYLENQKTDQDNVPSDNLLSVCISPGKAYVKGFDIEKSETTILDIEKPRDKETISSSLIPFEMGNLLKVNNVSGSPVIGIGNTYTISFYDERKNSTTSSSGIKIGEARAYSFGLSDSPYSDSSSNWNLYMFDVQTYTKLVLNQSVDSSSCPKSSYIKGMNSGASGYVVIDPTDTTLILTQTSGAFSPGEQILINGLSQVSRTIQSIRSYSVNDIKSVYQDCTSIGLSTNFVADTYLSRQILENFNLNDVLRINATTGIASCAGRNFVGINTGTIIRYQRPGFTVETFNKISSVSSDGLVITLSGVSTVSGICDGGIPTSTTTATFSIGSPLIQNQEKASLYAKLNNKNISDINFVGSDLKISRQSAGKSTNSLGTLTVSLSDVGIGSAYFENFDAEKYSVFYSDGSVESLTSDKFSLDGSGTFITLSGLLPSKSNIVVNSSIKKNSIKNKRKLYTKSEKLVVDKSIFDFADLGLSKNNYYGLRVEDEEISLNVPDVAKIIAIYESIDQSSPTLDGLNFQTGLNLNTNSILGEQIVGQSSGAIAQLVTKISSTKVEFVYLNSSRFITGESVKFKESNITASIQSIDKGFYTDRTNDFTLDKGQKDQYYDYSKIIRKTSTLVPSRQLLVIFDYYNVPSDDSGDVYTVSSYGTERFERDIPVLPGNIRASDVLDFRPRVIPFTSTSKSPFDFSSRSFASSGNNSSLVLTPNESSIVGYSYYLPRIDKIVLNKNGIFTAVKGISALNPKEPTSIDDSMDVAILNLPAYLYNPNDVSVALVSNKRYTMKDIGSLEKRIENIEITSSLSLLEVNTKSLQILDSDGINRFKTGFFVDDFKNNEFIDLDNLDANCIINKKTQELNCDISSHSLKSELGVSGDININTADFSADLSLLDSNVKKTGDLITLNYTEVSAGIGQTYATTKQNVNPAGVSNYNGYVKLTPSSDTWVRSINSENKVVIKTQGEWNDSFINDLVLSTNPLNKFKSRNIQFYATGLQPNTQYYSFFDGNSNIDIIPKLLKISMGDGSSAFQTGESVNAYFNGVKVACFRLSSSDHKQGVYNSISPKRKYTQNPYTTTLTLAPYTSSSTILNIDTFSLSDDSSGRFFGYLPQGATLLGQSSGAQAQVLAQSLITDNYGDLIGSFFIRDPSQTPTPLISFGVGTKTFKLSSSSVNSSSTLVSFTQNTFYANGIVNSQTNFTSICLRRTSPAIPLSVSKTDPLSQTFRTDNDGMFLTSIDLYFFDKDPQEKLYIEIREIDIGGIPKNNLIQDYARVEVFPEDITISETGQIPTNIKFSSPVYLEPNKQYSISLLCSFSSRYVVWTGQSNQPTVATQNLPNVEQVLYSNNYIGGNLYKSQNGGTWNSSLSEDLCFNLYKSNFTSTRGSVYFHNPNISVGSTSNIDDLNISKLISNPIKTLPRKLNVGITTSPLNVVETIFVPGRKILEGGAYGYIEKVGGNVIGITTSNVGVGYSNGSFSQVPLYNITGQGINATANIVVSNNKISSVSIASSGSGYVVGDVLGITTSSVVKGSGAKITVSSTDFIDTLYLTNVQGSEFTINQPLSYLDGSDVVSMASTSVTKESYVPHKMYSGNVFEVTQYNHGMHSNNNILVINNVTPNTTGYPLTANIVSNSLSISLASTANFTTFEGKTVSSLNPGYVLINNEVISYTSVGTNSLEISQRGLFNSQTKTHSIGDLIYKYELNGVSLTRINKQHTMPSDSSLKSMRGVDTYHLEFDRNYIIDRTTGDDQLSFIDQKTVGGSNVRSSQNIQFSSIIPYFNVLTPEKTSVSSSLRTISGTSINGTESSFVDQSYQPILLNDVNYFATPRLVASRINEINLLPPSSFTNQKSLSLSLSLSTNNPNLSPVIDTSEAATFIFNRNRINRPIDNYAFDPRSNTLNDDPHSSVYISKKVNLKQPASSLKVILSAYRHSSSDFRVLYKLFKADSSEISQSYQLFPGYKNLVDTDGDGLGDSIVDVSLNDGLSDLFVRSSNDNEFLEYQFTANNLDQFTGFVIKIVMSGTNESYAPRFKDLRTIALA